MAQDAQTKIEGTISASSAESAVLTDGLAGYRSIAEARNCLKCANSRVNHEKRKVMIELICVSGFNAYKIVQMTWCCDSYTKGG